MDIIHKKHKKKFKRKPVSSNYYNSNIGIPLMIVLSMIALIFGVLFGLAISNLFEYCN